MASYDTRLIDRMQVARDTAAYHLEKPQGFAHQPGQTISVTLPAGPDATKPALRHTFSLVSAPHEDTLCIATRLRGSDYKRTLDGLAPGTPLRFSGPYGKRVLPGDAARPLVLIAGGIGITPYMSMLRHATHAGTPHRFVLLYSCRHEEDAAFLSELRELARLNPNIRLLPTLTAPGPAWQGLRGRIDAQAVQGAAQGLSEPWVYITGVPAMVEGLGDALAAAGIPQESIQSEGFHGY